MISSNALDRITNFRLMLHRQFLPWVSELGTPSLRRWAAEHFPSGLVRLMVKLLDSVHTEAVNIFEDRKKALQEGDDSMSKQVGNGKDIMSVLCEYFKLPFRHHFFSFRTQ